MSNTSGTPFARRNPYQNQDVFKKLDLKVLRSAIPSHCFKRNYIVSLAYLLRDIFLIFSSSTLAWTFNSQLPSGLLRTVSWLIYGYVQGLLFTGIWVLGHECGHGAFSPSITLNETVGFAVHSLLLTPYFAWKSTHRRHHRFTAHMEKDHTHVPPRRKDYMSSLGAHVHHCAHDAPLYVLARVCLQQTLGWPLYLIFATTSGPGSTARKAAGGVFQKSHFNPYGALFQPRETKAIILSDIGVAITLTCLLALGHKLGFGKLFLLYGQPFLWLNQWIVIVTYLQHTHPKVPRFEAQSWTFIKGATATVDRDLGFIGRFFLHNVTDFHVVHHLFPRIPFYCAQEATMAIRPLLGDIYREDKENFLPSLWKVYKNCQWVAPDDATAAEDRALWFQPGCIPPLKLKSYMKGILTQDTNTMGRTLKK